ncbi:hypothetical protein RCL1_007593 [Eukaryota sp. TZLM3-RCL]
MADKCLTHSVGFPSKIKRILSECDLLLDSLTETESTKLMRRMKDVILEQATEIEILKSNNSDLTFENFIKDAHDASLSLGNIGARSMDYVTEESRLTQFNEEQLGNNLILSEDNHVVLKTTDSYFESFALIIHPRCGSIHLTLVETGQSGYFDSSIGLFSPSRIRRGNHLENFTGMYPCQKGTFFRTNPNPNPNLNPNPKEVLPVRAFHYCYCNILILVYWYQ